MEQPRPAGRSAIVPLYHLPHPPIDRLGRRGARLEGRKTWLINDLVLHAAQPVFPAGTSLSALFLPPSVRFLRTKVIAASAVAAAAAVKNLLTVSVMRASDRGKRRPRRWLSEMRSTTTDLFAPVRMMATNNQRLGTYRLLLCEHRASIWVRRVQEMQLMAHDFTLSARVYNNKFSD